MQDLNNFLPSGYLLIIFIIFTLIVIWSVLLFRPAGGEDNLLESIKKRKERLLENEDGDGLQQERVIIVFYFLDFIFLKVYIFSRINIKDVDFFSNILLCSQQMLIRLNLGIDLTKLQKRYELF